MPSKEALIAHNTPDPSAFSHLLFPIANLAFEQTLPNLSDPSEGFCCRTPAGITS